MTLPSTDTAGASTEQTFALEGGLSRTLAIAIGAVLVIEGTVLHLWVASRSRVRAWAISALNLVTLVWLWWEVQSGARSMLRIGAADVVLTVGGRLHCRIPRRAIARAERATWRSVPQPAPRDYVNVAKPIEPNVLIALREPVVVRLSLGITKHVSRFGVRVRDADAVVAALPNA
jgi:hypothetical protein